MKKLILMTTLLVAGTAFAQDSMNNDYNGDDNYGYGNHRGRNHMNSDSDRGHGNRMGRGHMNSDRDNRGHGKRMSGHMKGGDCCGDRNGGHSSRGSSYNSQMPMDVQQQIQAIEQKYEVQRLAIDQKYDTQNIAFRAQYDKLYGTMNDEDMRPMNNILTPEQAQFMLQMDKLDAQRNQIIEEKRNEVRALENQASDAIDSITQKWLSSIK